MFFGKDAETWSNTKIKNVFDVVLGKIGQNDNQAGLGLSIKRYKEPVLRLLTQTLDYTTRENLCTTVWTVC